MAKISWKRRNVTICVGILLLIATAFYLVPEIYIFCNDSTSLSQINDLCKLYSDEKVTGDLCKALCIDKTLKFQKCLHINKGKIVLHMSLNATFFVIMKSEHANLNNYLAYDFQKFNYPEKALDVPASSVLRASIDGLVKSRFGKEIDVTRVKRWNIPKENEFQAPSLMTTLWILLQQDEYRMMSYLHGGSGIPELYGNCGHFYVTEYLPPGKYLSGGNFLRKVFPAEWKRRAELALQLLDLMQAFDSEFDVPVLFCDMKGWNFGVDSHGKVKAIDLDMASFETFLQSYYAQLKCSEDLDCTFFDCDGWCHPELQKCLPFQINSNLQSLCDKVFIGGIWDHAFVGLLDSPPPSVKFQLEEALDRCRNPPLNQHKGSIIDNCRTVLDQQSLSSDIGAGNSSSASEFRCRKAVEEFRTFLAEETLHSYRRLTEILERTVNN